MPIFRASDRFARTSSCGTQFRPLRNRVRCVEGCSSSSVRARGLINLSPVGISTPFPVGSATPGPHRSEGVARTEMRAGCCKKFAIRSPMKTASVPSGWTLRNAVGDFKLQLIVARKKKYWTTLIVNVSDIEAAAPPRMSRENCREVGGDTVQDQKSETATRRYRQFLRTPRT